MIQLYTEHLLIRDHISSDLTSHHELLSNKKVMWFIQDIMTENIEETEANLHTAIEKIGCIDRKYYFFRIENKHTHEHIGEIGYTVLDFTPVGKHVEIGYFIRDAYWGLGYTPEALKGVIKFAFEKNNVYRITCGCLKENRSSERVMQKCGMIKEAEFKECQWHDGMLKDRVIYRLLRSEWNGNLKDPILIKE